MPLLMYSPEKATLFPDSVMPVPQSPMRLCRLLLTHGRGCPHHPQESCRCGRGCTVIWWGPHQERAPQPGQGAGEGW